MELPRVPIAADARLTYDPSLTMRSLRRGFDIVRILLPMTITIMLLALLYWAVTAVGIAHGAWAMAALTIPLLVCCGLLACLFTVALKWLLIGRYRPGKHPFYSTFVWRDEIINSMQEVVAGGWLLTGALGSPIMNVYLRAMGAKVGRDAYVETLAITEYDQVDIGAAASINRGGCVETHLFQDRVMQIGPAKLGSRASIGSRSAVLLETEMGESSRLGMRSVLLRGESLPARTRWVGAPVVAE
jgi:non-ribosomal peptide synthetase-like protein